MSDTTRGLNDAEREQALRMWADGNMSSGMIAAEMSRRLRRTVTRNSIIGYIHRASAQRNPPGSEPRVKNTVARRKPAVQRPPEGRPRSSDGRLTVTKASPAPRVAVASPPSPPPAQPRSIVRTKTRNVPLTEATHGGCRYEVTGSFKRSEYLFCNTPVQNDGKPTSFCAEHHALCWTKPDKRHKKLEQAAAITA